MKQYDVVFLGSGHAAWHAALTLKQSGKQVAVVEKDTIAGTCTNYGCNAKILLEGPYEVLEEAKQYPNIIDSHNLEVNWKNLMHYKEQVINPMSETLTSMFEQQGIDVIMGKGKLVDAHTIEVNNTTLQSDYIVIATGQHSHQLDIEGKEYTHDSREFLSMQSLPDSITFIGAGIISIENTKSVKPNAQRFIVETESGKMIETDYVLDATGRKPNVQQIGLEKVGILFSDRGIEVDDYLRTNVKNIYASGDVINKMIPKLTPTATFESNYIAAHILGLNTDAIQYPPIPSVLYSLPRLSQIGVTVSEAKKDDTYMIKDIPFGRQMVFEYQNETEAEMSIVLDSHKRLVGAEIYGNDAGDLVNLLVFIINQKLTAQDLNKNIFAFPGASSGVIDLLKLAMM